MKLVTKLLIFLALALIPSTTYAAESFDIENFNVAIEIHEDATMTVRESIQVVFTEDRHGIFRDIPTDGIDLNFLGVTNEFGKSRPYLEQYFSQGKRMRIGDPDFYVSGNQTYNILYEVIGAVRSFDLHDELYWNATGSSWDTTIENVNVQITFPEKGLDLSEYKFTCFTGGYGESEKACAYDFDESINQVTFTAGNFTPHTGLTIVAGFPKGLVRMPASLEVHSNPDSAKVHLDDNAAPICQTNDCKFQISSEKHNIAVKKFGFEEITESVTPYAGARLNRLYELQKTNWFLILQGFFLMIAILVGLEPLYRLLKYGRDPEGRGSIYPRYEPPTLSPAEMGTLVDETPDIRDITSTIVDLAVRGYLKIKVLPKALGIIFKRDDYELIRLDKPKAKDRGLNSFENKMMTSLFGSKETKKISDLKNQFYERLPQLKKALEESLVKKGYFKSLPSTVRGIYFLVAFVIIFFGFLLLKLEYTFTGTFYSVGLITNGVLTFLLAHWMPRKTKAGKEMQEHILGLKMYMEVAEKDRMQFQEKENLFFELLPYAMTLKIADKWSNAFEGMFQEPPQWYDGTVGSFDPSDFTDHIQSISSTLETAFTSRPGGRSGGSGFGGGGFSGGGGGGGGGGSW